MIIYLIELIAPDAQAVVEAYRSEEDAYKSCEEIQKWMDAYRQILNKPYKEGEADPYDQAQDWAKDNTPKHSCMDLFDGAKVITRELQ